MQYLSAQPLIDDFRSGTFDDEDLAPYVLLPAVLGTLALALDAVDYGEFDPWIAMAAIATAPITLFGVLHLKAQNGGTFGNDFLQKLFTLGWVTGIRTILLAIPCGFAFVTLATILAGEGAFDPAFALCQLGFEAAYYLWLGALFKEANPIQS